MHTLHSVQSKSTLGITLSFHSIQCEFDRFGLRAVHLAWSEVKWRWRRHRRTISETQQNQKTITVIIISTIIITITVTWWWRLSCAGDSEEACAIMEPNAITLTALRSSDANRNSADCSSKTNTASTVAPVASCIQPPQRRRHRHRQLFRFQIRNLNQVLFS